MANRRKIRQLDMSDSDDDASNERKCSNSNCSTGLDIPGVSAIDFGCVLQGRLVESETWPSFPFESLPHVVFLKILSLLTLKELARGALVCKLWYVKCYEPCLWRKLNFKGMTKVTDEVFGHLTSLSTNITYLNISECKQLTESCIVESLKMCYCLQEIRVIRCPRFSDKCLECIGQTCRRLKSIDISLCPVTDEGVEKLCQGCTNLQSLSMDQCRRLTNKCLHHVAMSCPILRFISVEYISGVGNEGVKELVWKCPLLNTLHLNSCGVTNMAIHAIAQYCQNLTVLDMRHCLTMEDENVGELALYCLKLQVLNLSLCFKVTDLSIKHILQFCVNLRNLYIVHCKITDRGLEYFIQLRSACMLERLDLSWCQAITDTGVQHVVNGCRSLKHLGLMRCDKVSEETVSSLSSLYPNLYLSTVMTEMNRMMSNMAAVEPPAEAAN